MERKTMAGCPHPREAQVYENTEEHSLPDSDLGKVFKIIDVAGCGSAHL